MAFGARSQAKEDLAETELDRDSLGMDNTEKAKQLESERSGDRDAVQARLTALRDLVAQSPSPLAHDIEKLTAKPVVSAPPRPAPTAAPDFTTAAHVRLSLTPTSRSVGTRPVYDVKFWVDLPADVLPSVLDVEYYFDHPTFVPKLRTSFDPTSHFSLSYLGYGCVAGSTVTVVTRDRARHPLPFDMCALWAASKPH